MGSDSASSVWNRFLLKVKYSFYSMLVFVIFANPETLRLLNVVFGGLVQLVDGGCPTVAGLGLSAGLFFTTMLGLMMLPSE